MKEKPDTALFEVPFGSHLYGTNGPNSDLDFKVVCLPSLETILMNTKVTNRKVTPEGKTEGQKMLAGEAEYEYIPLQIFLDDFFNGQTYAIEIAFAVLGNDHFEDTTVKHWIQTLVDKFLTRNVTKMVGYAVSQSRNYGLKTERYNSLKEAIRTLDEYSTMNVNDGKISTLNHTNILMSLESIKHVKMTQIANGGGGTEMVPAIDICGKEFPLTVQVGTVIKSLKGSIAKYGDRVKQYDGQGVDWKALSHAIRITSQVLDLCEFGKIQYPLPYAGYLREVKEGQIDLSHALEHLTLLFNRVDESVEKSVLPERTPELEENFYLFKLRLLRYYYGI